MNTVSYTHKDLHDLCNIHRFRWILSKNDPEVWQEICQVWQAVEVVYGISSGYAEGLKARIRRGALNDEN